VAPVSQIIEDPSALAPLRDGWDGLAVASRRPYCSPAWMLAWWDHARPDGARLRVVAVTEGDELVGIAPLWVAAGAGRGSRYRLLAGGLSAPVSPLALPGREREVAAAVAEALAGADPRPHSIRLEGQQGAADWPAWLSEGWPRRRPWRHSALPVAAPAVSLEGLDYERWLGGKTQNFRQQARRMRRKLEGDGARFAIAGPGEVGAAVEAFARLHGSRWEERGGSNALVTGIEGMLVDAAEELVPLGRFRAATIELEGRPIAVQLLLAAGGEVVYWNGGFDEEFQRYRPAVQALLFAVDDAMARGDHRLDLGPGAQDYKLRMADGEERVDTITLVPRGRSYPLARLRLAPYQARWALSRRLTPEAKKRVRGLLRR
jgi:CelD/BcsL family acetyltransferase involved in cellulose biosynthesis